MGGGKLTVEWLQNNWQFLIGDILIPVGTFIIGLFIGKGIEKKKAQSSINNGSGNTVIQNSEVHK